MSFRSRLALALAALAIAPLLLFGLGVRARIRTDLASRYRLETEALATDLRTRLAAEGEDIESRLDAMADAARADDRLRLGLSGRASGDREYLLDYGGRAMRLAGLSMLQLLDADGRVLSSGHFRNEFGRLEPGVAARVGEAVGGAALLRVAAPSGSFLVLARTAPVRIAGRPLVLLGGVKVDSAFLAGLVPGREVALRLAVPGTQAVAVGAVDAEGAGEESVTRTIDLSFVRTVETPGFADEPAVGTARLRIVRSLAPLVSLRHEIDLWLGLGLVAVAAVALLFGAWLAGRLSRPLGDLARRTARLDLDRLDVAFPTERDDEIGVLARGLRELTDRLRAGAVRLREAERRATLGEIARQVNHDVRNGLTPLRHVVRHLAEVARREPDRLPAVFEERRDSLESGIDYLETLASRYGRLSSRPERRPTDAGALVVRVAADAAGSGADVAAEVEPGLPAVLADPVALRRVLDNLVRNALESLEDGQGTIRVRALPGARAGRVRLEVEDTGRGVTEDERERMFEQFYTTRVDGAGLGLAIVRRLVTDMEGAIEVTGRPGRGTRFVVELPAAAATGPGEAAP